MNSLTATVRGLLFLVVFVCFTMVRTQPTSSQTPTTKSTEPPQVVLIIDYGDGVQKHFRQLPWKNEMTVWDALQQAQRHARGIKVEHRGQRDTLLITKIDDLANEGGTGRNWMMRVNDELATRSAGITPIQSGDTIRWSFETFE